MRARIIAPAGSGKTRVLTERARHLLAILGARRGAHPRRVQQARPARDGGADRDLPGLQVQTLNALALAILNGSRGFARASVEGRHRRRARRPRAAGLAREVPPASEHGSRRVVDRRALERSAWACGARGPSRRSSAATSRVSPRCSRATGPSSRGEAWWTSTSRSTCCLEVLLTEPEVRRQAERRCQLLLVDEFQDLTPAHMLLLRLLAGPTLSVFGVGDDDQTIYGYSGASPRWLVDFDAFIPAARHHALTVNYRCPLEVVEGGHEPGVAEPCPGQKDHHRGPRRRVGADGASRSFDTSGPPSRPPTRVRQLAGRGRGALGDRGAHPGQLPARTRPGRARGPRRPGAAARRARLPQPDGRRRRLGVAPTRRRCDRAVARRPGARGAAAVARDLAEGRRVDRRADRRGGDRAPRGAHLGRPLGGQGRRLRHGPAAGTPARADRDGRRAPRVHERGPRARHGRCRRSTRRTSVATARRTPTTSGRSSPSGTCTPILRRSPRGSRGRCAPRAPPAASPSRPSTRSRASSGPT